MGRQGDGGRGDKFDGASRASASGCVPVFPCPPHSRRPVPLRFWTGCPIIINNTQFLYGLCSVRAGMAISPDAHRQSRLCRHSAEAVLSRHLFDDQKGIIQSWNHC